MKGRKIIIIVITMIFTYLKNEEKNWQKKKILKKKLEIEKEWKKREKVGGLKIITHHVCDSFFLILFLSFSRNPSLSFSQNVSSFFLCIFLSKFSKVVVNKAKEFRRVKLVSKRRREEKRKEIGRKKKERSNGGKNSSRRKGLMKKFSLSPNLSPLSIHSLSFSFFSKNDGWIGVMFGDLDANSLSLSLSLAYIFSKFERKRKERAWKKEKVSEWSLTKRGERVRVYEHKH